MRAANQHDPDDEPLDDELVTDEVDDFEEEALDALPEDEEAFALDAETQGLVHKLYSPEEDEEDEDF
jgi:hypothetical protein